MPVIVGVRVGGTVTDMDDRAPVALRPGGEVVYVECVQDRLPRALLGERHDQCDSSVHVRTARPVGVGTG